MRAVLFTCAQSYLCAFNVVYSETPNNVGVLLQILCIFSEVLLTLGECLYIWSIMYILSYSRNKMFYIHKRKAFVVLYILFFRSPPPLFWPIHLLNSWLSRDLPQFIKTPRLFGTLEYVRSMLFMCVQCYLCVYNVIFMCVQAYLCTFNAI